MDFATDFFEIRIESFSGLGATSISKILGKGAALKLGLNVSILSNYSLIKTGGHIKYFIRYAKENIAIRRNFPIEAPEILVIFHEDLLKEKNVTAGISENTKVIINTKKTPEEMREDLKMYAGTLYCIDAFKIARHFNTKINMPILGAILSCVSFINFEDIEEILQEELKNENAFKNALNAIKKAYEEVSFKNFAQNEKFDYKVYKEDNFNIFKAGGINKILLNTDFNKKTFYKENNLPIFKKEKCINCLECDSVCPDMCFKLEKKSSKEGETFINLGIDYDFCKGCLRCVEICRTKALSYKNKSL